MGEVVSFGHWPFLDKILKAAEANPRFTQDTRAQAHLLHALSRPNHGYWHIPPEHQQEVLSRVMHLVPRVGNSPTPKATLEAIFKLWLTADPFENISRAVKVTPFTPRPALRGEELFPTDGFIGAFIQWCRESDVPLGYYFWAAVAAIAAACRYNFFIDRNTDKLRLSHYFLFVGDKATGKSTAMDAACEVISYLNGLVWGWRPGQALPPLNDEHPFHVRILAEDTNQETLVRNLAPREVPTSTFVAESDFTTETPKVYEVESTGLLALDELATFLGKDNWAITKRVPFLTRINAGKPYKYHTQKGGIIILREPALTMIGCCTPDWMKDAISPLMFGGGFMDRTLLVYREPLPPPPLFPTPRPRDPLAAQQLAAFLLPLTARFRREELVATPEAEAWYENWYVTQVEPVESQEPSLKRKGNHLWWLAAILSISDSSAPYIHLRHFQMAAAIFDAEWVHFRKMLGILDEPPEAAQMNYIEAVLHRAGAVEPEYMMKNELFRVLRNRKGLTPPTVKAIPLLQSLEAAGRIRHLLNVSKLVGQRANTGEAYQLTLEAAAERDAGQRGRLRVVKPAPDPLDEEATASGDESPPVLKGAEHGVHQRPGVAAVLETRHLNPGGQLKRTRPC